MMKSEIHARDFFPKRERGHTVTTPKAFANSSLGLLQPQDTTDFDSGGTLKEFAN